MRLALGGKAGIFQGDRACDARSLSTVSRLGVKTWGEIILQVEHTDKLGL